MGESQQYRRDIDGLRAIAIIPVVLYHLSFRYTPGGFIGVDIFFVISGFLITQHVAPEIEAGTFSLVSFYERRIRRIFPALIVMLAGTSILAYWLLLPVEMIDFGKALVASILSVSNVYFWLHTNYFEITDKPLLHTWSLGVEEQFYVLLPITLLLLHRYWKQRLRTAIVILAFSSFVLSTITVVQFPSATFYLLPQRAWELLLGSILALRIVPSLRNRLIREIGSGVGLLSIIVMATFFQRNWPFPGPIALVPCGAAAMIIEAGKRAPTVVSKLISSKPMVGIGLISYSVYLWHLPLIVFQSYLTRIVFGRVFSLIFPFLSFPQAVTLERDFTLFALSILAGAVSWKFVEQPFRFGRFRPTRRHLFIGAGLAALLLVSTGEGIVFAKGMPGRFDPEVVAIGSYTESQEHDREGSCSVGDIRQYNARECLKEDRGRPNWLLLGDSHGAHLYYGLSQVFPEVNLLQWTPHGCKPVPSFHFSENENCYKAARSMYQEYLPNHHLDGIILAGNWQSYDLPRLGEALLVLNKMGQHVVLIGPIMHYDLPLRRLLAEEVESGDTGLAERHRELSYDDLDRTMAKLAHDEWKVRYFSYERNFCFQQNCTVWSALNVPFQWDQSHLLDGGSVLTAKSLRREGIIPISDTTSRWQVSSRE